MEMSEVKGGIRYEISMDSVSVMILAGGLGTRLRSVLSNIPKCLAPINGKPFLKLQLDVLEKAGFRHVVLCTGHMADLVCREIGTNHGSIKIDYSNEQQPLGTAGALRLALAKTEAKWLLVLNGDSFCEVNLGDFLNECGFVDRAGMVLAQVNDIDRYGCVETESNGRVSRFLEKGASGSGWVNAGIYLIHRDLVGTIKAGTKISLEHEIFPEWVRDCRMAGFKASGRFIDIGTPKSLLQAADFFKKLDQTN